MSRTLMPLVLCLSLAGFATGCPAPGTGPGAGGRGGGGGGGSAAGGVNPDACGPINTSKVGRKLYAFLVASAELDRASLELEQSVKGACIKMAQELQVATDGDTKTVCDRAIAALDANLEISVSKETRMVTRVKPAECTTNIDFMAGIVAECEATVAADVNIQCEGSCGGTCSGQCDGTCAATNASGQCAGECNGTCRGSCSADCQGYADVSASAECKASAEVRASVNTTCTEPEVEVVQQDVTVVDDTKFQMAMAAIRVGMPTLLKAGAKAKLVAKAAVLWAQTAGSLVKSSGQIIGEIGERGLCVGGQLAGALAAVAQVEARFTVSIEVSASVSASAGGGGA
jgi:hypothetical protein